MAWVEKLPSGRYRAVYRDVDGKRKSLGVFTHKRAAQDAGGDKEAELRRGVGKRPEMTWGEWREQWWANRAVEESTLKREATMRVKHIDDHWDDVLLSEITRQDIRDWAVGLTRQIICAPGGS